MAGASTGGWIETGCWLGQGGTGAHAKQGSGGDRYVTHDDELLMAGVTDSTPHDHRSSLPSKQP